jgi:LmbE family N-acetylglucosaminyl deacetylase
MVIDWAGITHDEDSVGTEGNSSEFSLRDAYRRLIQVSARPLREIDLGAPTLVFAPHMDDETLGCGGTVILKRQMEVPVHIAFVTDGGRSHDLIDRDALIALRKQEAVAAATVLGVGPADVHFLDLPDGRVRKCTDMARKRIADLVATLEFEQVFIPCRWDVHWDHVLTNRIVREVLQSRGRSVEVFEYPTWLWDHWPWVSDPVRLRGKQRFRHRVKQWLLDELQVVLRFRVYTDVSDVTTRKRQALDQHVTQMTRYVADPDWAILADASNGEWLANFFTGREMFHRYRLCG